MPIFYWDRNDSRLDFWVARCEQNRHQLVVSSTQTIDGNSSCLVSVNRRSQWVMASIANWLVYQRVLYKYI